MPSWMELEQHGNHPKITRGMLQQAQSRRAQQMHKAELAAAKKERARLNKIARIKALMQQKAMKTYRDYEYDKIKKLDELRLEAETQEDYKDFYKKFYEHDIRQGLRPEEPPMSNVEYLKKIYSKTKKSLPYQLYKLRHDLGISSGQPGPQGEQQQVEHHVPQSRARVEEISTKLQQQIGKPKVSDYFKGEEQKKKPKTEELPPKKKPSFVSETKKTKTSKAKSKNIKEALSKK